MTHFIETIPAVFGAAVTPSDSTDITGGPCRSLLIGTAGVLRVTLAEMTTGNYVELTVPAGYNPIQAKRVWSTNTTAASIAALW